jgi:hypothetical protein
VRNRYPGCGRPRPRLRALGVVYQAPDTRWGNVPFSSSALMSATWSRDTSASRKPVVSAVRMIESRY